MDIERFTLKVYYHSPHPPILINVDWEGNGGWPIFMSYFVLDKIIPLFSLFFLYLWRKTRNIISYKQAFLPTTALYPWIQRWLGSSISWMFSKQLESNGLKPKYFYIQSNFYRMKCKKSLFYLKSVLVFLQ